MKKNKLFLYKDRTIIRDKIKESFSSVLPISIIVLLLCFTISPIPADTLLAFLVCVALVVVGMGLFTLGADTAMTPIGEYVGTGVVKSKKLWLIIPVFFLVGVLITVSEPDLTVLAEQLSEAVDKYVLIISVGVGVGLFLVFAFLRSLLNIKLKYVLLFFYVLTFVLSFFVPKAFLSVAFDSGGVTTGPMSVPFIIAIGTGIAGMRSDKNADSDGFGLTALCSIGPILSVMILGLIYKPETINSSSSSITTIADSQDLLTFIGKGLPTYMGEVALALTPIVVFFLLFSIFGQKIDKANYIRIIIGILYTYVGLVLFLTGVNLGFLPVGKLLGEKIGALSYNWILIPIGMLIGFFVVAAEPAVHVLTKQVYEITSGAIPKKALSVSLMIGVAVSVGIAMMRILFRINIMWILIPGYAIALILMFFVPDIFTAIAFDSGGVASGAMATGFLLPLALGACSTVGTNVSVAQYGFGVVAMVAMTPLITIQILGLVYKIKTKKAKSKTTENISEEIID